jgi:hypothetical protein
MFEHTVSWLVRLPGVVAADARGVMRSASCLSRRQPVAAEGVKQPRAAEQAGHPAPVSTAPISEAWRAAQGEVIWLSKRELAEHLHLSKSWVERQARINGLPSRLAGGVRRYRLDEIEAWMREQELNIPNNRA